MYSMNSILIMYAILPILLRHKMINKIRSVTFKNHNVPKMIAHVWRKAKSKEAFSK